MFDAFVNVMLGMHAVSLFVYTVHLLGEHPRYSRISVGADTLGWLLSAGLLAWISVIKFGG
jgi:hypothetical protein